LVALALCKRRVRSTIQTRAVLFKNDNKQSDKHADYRGEVNAAGVDYWLNGYVRTSKKGVKFIAFKLKPKQQEAAASASEA
jgi:hypothetical protein